MLPGDAANTNAVAMPALAKQHRRAGSAIIALLVPPCKKPFSELCFTGGVGASTARMRLQVSRERLACRESKQRAKRGHVQNRNGGTGRNEYCRTGKG